MRTRPRNSLEQFVLATGLALANRSAPADWEEVHTRALIAVEASHLRAEAVSDIRRGMSRIRSLVKQFPFYGPEYSVIEQMRRRRPDFLQVRAELQQEIDDLKPFVNLLGDSTHKPDGYTAQELRQQAEIGRDLWQRILRKSGLVPTGRGGQHRRFSVIHIRALVTAARDRIKTPKAKQAAAAWLELVNELPDNEAREPGI